VKRKLRPVRLGIFLIVGCLLVVTTAAIWFVIAYNVSSGIVSASTSKPVRSVEEIQMEIEGNMLGDAELGSYYAEFRATFPDDFNELTQTVAREIAAGNLRTPADTGQLIQQFFDNFRVRNAGAVMRADTSILVEIADQNYLVAQLFRSEGAELCAAFTITGLPPTFRPSGSLKTETAKLTLLNLRATKSGQDRPAVPHEPTAQQMDIADMALEETGVPALLLDAYRDGSISKLSKEEQCTVGVAATKAVAEMPDEMSAFWSGYLAAR
jgi:hypothetical protein